MKNILASFLLSLILTPSLGQDLQSVFLDSIISNYAKEHSIVGLSIGVVHRGQAQTKSFGTTSYDNNTSVNGNTIFNIASISKLFTSIAITQLIEENELKLDDKLYEVLPDFRMKDKRYRAITIRHLLTHSSGLPWDHYLSFSPDDESSIPLLLKSLEKEKLQFAPGKKMSYNTYSNVAFDLLGIVVEKLSGENFPNYIRDHILRPNGMNNSSYCYEEIDSSLLALPQIIAGDSKEIKRLNFQGKDDKKNPILNGQPLELTTHNTIGDDYEHNPSGNLLSSTEELNLWMKNILDVYHSNANTTKLSKTVLDLMWKEQIKMKDSNISVGLGWWIKNDIEKGRSYFHVGTNPGYCSILMIYPKEELGIVILSNGWYAQDTIWQKLFYDISKMYLEQKSD